MAIALLLLSALTPAALIILCQRLPLLEKAGVVVLTFVAGIGISALLAAMPLWLSLSEVRTSISEITIALALPMLVFSIDVKASLRMAGNTLKSMAFALLSVLLVSAASAFVYAGQLDNVWQIAGMSVGAYTGGGPNMAAIKTATGADETLFTTMITYDILLSSLYLLFVMTLAKPLFSRLLKPYRGNDQNAEHESSATFAHLADETAYAYRILLQKNVVLNALGGLLISAAIVALAVAVASVVPGSMASAVTIITITSLGVAASFIPFVRQLKGTFQLGMYLILIFCFTTGSMTDTGVITDLNMALFSYIGAILLGSLLLQALLCRLFNIDTDTFLITSSAAIMSVPFIPVIAGAIKNRAIILPGFAAAIIGYILGNYLGIVMAWFTRWLISA